MATVLGAGASLATAWLLDPVATVRAREDADEQPPPSSSHLRSEAAAAIEENEASVLLSRVIGVLGTAPSGLPLFALRALVSEPTEVVQRALLLGLRTKQLRRVGAHNKLRYVRNT
jgi:hypothetical protein